MHVALLCFFCVSTGLNKTNSLISVRFFLLSSYTLNDNEGANRTTLNLSVNDVILL